MTGISTIQANQGAQATRPMSIDRSIKQPSTAPYAADQLDAKEKWLTKRRLFLLAVYAVSIGILIALFMKGSSYYLTPYADRPHHPDYRSLRPAGSAGLIYGMIGASMMILMLVYTLRKRFSFLGQKLPIRYLLDFHIYMGVIGPLFIVLHTSFKVQGLVAVSFWSMVAVALSGYLGRYLYKKIPRNIDQQELSLQDMAGVQQYLTHEVQQVGGLDNETARQVQDMFDRAFSLRGTGTLSILWNLMIGDLKRPFTARRLRRRLRRLTGLPTRKLGPLFDVAYQRARLAQRIAALDKVQNLFHYWHVIHKPFAIIMYIIMLVHIGVAVWTGYGWIR